MEPAVNGQTAIRIRDVNYWFGTGDTRTQVLFDVQLAIGRGEVVILTGPSGSGKTTLLTLIGALRRVERDGGSVEVLGHELAGMRPGGQVQLRREIGFIFQHHNLFTSLTGFENVRMATALRDGSVDEMNARAAALLERLGLGERMHALPGRLSGGQRQRVAIARALVNRPALILADEPTAALDAASGQEVLNILHELADGPSQSTILIVTHDQRVLDRADRIVNLVGGQVVSNVQPAVTIRICKILQRNADLGDLSPSTLARLADHMFVEVHQPGEILTREGESGDRFYIIGRGEAEQIRDDQVVRTLTEGARFGQITSSAHPIPVAETVRARTELEVFVMTKENFRRVLAFDHSFEEHVRLQLMNRQGPT
jgi:putative ABC transport system ATP-binding protein